MTDIPSLVESVPELCAECKQLRVMCFCGAPKTEALRLARLQWAVIDHPYSDNIELRIERMLAQPQSFQDFAKELERENGDLATEVIRLQKELEAEKRKVEVATKDKERMDKLEYLDVTVRIPLVYGSREAFMSSPEQGDGEEEPSDIRAQLDKLKLK